MKLILISLMALLLLSLSASTFGQSPAQMPPKVEQSTSSVTDTAVRPPEHPATKDQIREYMSLTGIARTTHTVMAKSIEAMKATAAPYYPASLWVDMTAEFNNIDDVSICVPIYQKFISQEDMAAIIAFYRSPAGKRILATQLPITAEASATMKGIGAEIGKRVFAKHKDEIEAAKKQFDEGKSKPKIDLEMPK